MRVQFFLKLDRERKSPFRIEAVDVPCALCGNDTNFSVVFRPFLISKLRVVRCDVCGLRFQRPMPTERFFEWMYGNRYLKRVSRTEVEDADAHTRASYDVYRRHADEILQFMMPHLPSHAAPTVLEIGSAHGCNLEAFRKVNRQAVLYEDEIDRRWETRYQEQRILNWNQRPDGTKADIIILSAVLEHFRNPVSELRRLRDLLNDQGAVYVEVPNVPEDLEYFAGFKLGHTFYFSEQSLRKTLEHAGFQPLESRAGNRLIAVCRKR